MGQCVSVCNFRLVGQINFFPGFIQFGLAVGRATDQ